MNEFNELVAKATLMGYWSFGIAIVSLIYVCAVIGLSYYFDTCGRHSKTFNNFAIISCIIGIPITLMGIAGTLFAWILVH